jgi:DNA-binding NarL/FixJ family response regulator
MWHSIGLNKWYEYYTGDRMVRILIIDDNLLIRHVLKMHIELDPDLEVVGEDEIGNRAEDLVLKYKPDVVLVDFDMSGSAGRKTVEELHQAAPELPVIGTSLNNGETNLIISKEAGAIDFVVKQADSVALIKAIRQAISSPG